MSKDPCSIKCLCTICAIIVMYVITLVSGIVLISVGIATANVANVEHSILQLLMAGIILVAIGPIILCFSYSLSVTCENKKIPIDHESTSVPRT